MSSVYVPSSLAMSPPIADSTLHAASPRWRYGPVCVSSACSLCVPSSGIFQFAFVQRPYRGLRLHVHHRDADADEPPNVDEPYQSLIYAYQPAEVVTPATTASMKSSGCARYAPRSPATNLDAPRLGRTASSCASCSCGTPGGVTIRCQVEQDCQGDPEPAPTGHTSSDRIDEDIGQGGNRQKENPQQWQDPAPVKCMLYQRCS
jgi:hypothetical protein